MKNFVFFVIASMAILCSCQQNCGKTESVEPVGVSDNLLNATLWMQHSAEYRACCLQTYRFAKTALAENLRTKSTDKPAAVVLDIDETVLDNTYYEAYLAANNTTFCDSTWALWSLKADATEVPGAKDFLEYAVSLGVEVIFVSNRYPTELETTIAKMQKLGFPEIPDKNFYLKEKGASSCKKERRDIVSQTYEIIMLVGDNMGDFTEEFDGSKSDGDMIAETDSLADVFGQKYIVLPNPTYGTWEKPILADTSKTSRQNRIDALKTF